MFDKHLTKKYFWEQRKFGDVVIRQKEITNSSNLPNVNYADIDSGTGSLNKDISKLSIGKSGVLFNKGNILFGKLRPYLDNRLFANFKGIAVGDFWVFEVSRNVNNYFIFNLIQTEKYKNISNISSGSKMPRSDWKLVSNYKFSFPKLNESIKIGDLVHKLDLLIKLQQRKRELISKLLLGTEQIVFSSNRLHKWQEYKLKQIATFHKGNGIKKNLLKERGQFPAVHYADLYKFKPVQKRVLHFINKREGKIISQNSLLFPGSDVTPTGLARTSTLLQNDAFAGGDVIIVNLKSKIVSAEFLSYEINYFKNKLIPLITGTTVRHIHINDIQELRIYIPKKELQLRYKSTFNKIAKEKIILFNNLSFLRGVKQFLLQNMFI